MLLCMLLRIDRCSSMAVSNHSKKAITTYRRLLNREPIPFVGRDEVILNLREHFNRVFNNEGSAVLIYGENGVGKTRLVEEFIDNIDHSDIFIFKGRAYNTGGPFIEPFNTIIDQSLQNFTYKTHIITKFISIDTAPIILRILPQLRTFYPVEIEPVVSNEEELFSAVYQIIENISRLKPMLIFIDDAHLLRPSARKLLEFIIERIEDKPIFFVICLTTSLLEQQRCMGLLTNECLQLCPVKLTRFSSNLTIKLICQIFQEELSTEFCQWVYRISKGNPFFIRELIKELFSHNVLLFNEKTQKWCIKKNYKDIEIPHSMKKIFISRLRKIEKEGAAYLEVASLLGERFQPDLVRQVLDFSVGQAKQVLARLYERYLIPVVETNSVQFIHPLLRETIRGDISQDKQRILHRRIAEVLKKVTPFEFSLRAQHATALITEKEYNLNLFHLVFNAAREQEQRGDLTSAYSYYNLALAIIDKYRNDGLGAIIIRAHLYILEQSLKNKDISPEEASAVTQRLFRFGLFSLGVNLYIAAYRSLYNQFRFFAAEKYIKKLLKLIAGYDVPRAITFRVRIEHCLVLRRTGEAEKVRAMVERLFKKYNPEDNFFAYGCGLNTLGLIHFREGDYEKASRLFNKLLEMAERFCQLGMKAVAQVNLASTYIRMGKFLQARNLLSDYQRMIYTSGKEYKLPILWEAYATCSYFEGKFEDSLKYFDKALECAVKDYHKFSCSLGKANVLHDLGKLDEAYSIIQKYLVDKIDPKGQEEWVSYFHILWAKCHLKQDNYKKARRFLLQAIRLSKRNKLHIEYATALVLKGVVNSKLNSKSREIDIRKGVEILKHRKAYSCLGIILCDVGFVFKDSGLFQEGLSILKKIGAESRIKFYIQKAKSCGLPCRSISFITKDKLWVQTFGGLKVHHSEDMDSLTNREWKSAKARELFCLLLLGTESNGMTWEELALHLWPNFGTKKARNNFHFTLSTLRDVLGSEYIIYQNNVYFINKEKIHFDLWDFEERYKEFKQSLRDKKQHLAQKYAIEALKIAESSFLPEFHNQLVEMRRLQINTIIEELLLWLANRYYEKFEYFEAIRCCYRLLGKDPMNETAHRIIIKAYIDSGERGRAIRQYKRLASLLKKNIGIEPSPETKKIIEKVGSTS